MNTHVTSVPLRVLVTGGAGFIGSHLCEALLLAGHEVVCLDNFATGLRENVAHLGQSRFKLTVHDVVEPFDVEVDQVFHLACPASPAHYQVDPIRTIRTCVDGTRNALECARAAGARILIASTSEVYGDPDVHPQVESYRGNVNSFGLRACYNEGKRCAEALAFAYAQQHCVDVRTARIFNTYGPRMRPDDGRVISSFIAHALRGEPLVVHGSGQQTRSFCYVDDLVDGLVRLMNVDEPAFDRGPVNLGNPEEVSIKALARAVAELCGATTAVEHCDPVADDPRRRCPDIERARRLLGWEPRIPLQDGLVRTITAARRQHSTSAHE